MFRVWGLGFGVEGGGCRLFGVGVEKDALDDAFSFVL